MEISVRIYEEITGQSNLPPPVDEADYERRKYRRVPFGHRAIVSPERKGFDDTPAVVMVRDVSVGGVSFLHDEALKVGTPFVIEFKGHQDRPVQLHCNVVRCEAGGSGGTQFVVGAAFDAVLTEELPADQPREIPKLVPLAPVEVDDEPDPLADEPIYTDDPVLEQLAVAAGTAAPAPVKSSALFKSADPTESKKAVEEYWSEGEPAAAATPADTKPAPELNAPVFRVIPMPQPEKPEPVKSEPEQPEPPKEVAVAKEPRPQISEDREKNHEVLARVKELLVRQEQLIESQRQELKGQRERFEKEIESTRLDLEDAKTKLAELRSKSEADDNAIADLANFVREHAGGESPDQKSQAA